VFGPDSVTWRVHADPTMGFAGLRALVLQALHPVAMAGVAQHSAFRTDPWGRLFRTAEYVGVTTYGTPDEAERAAARVRGIHRRLRGVDPRTGRSFRLDDPELLLWVHCAEVDSYVSVARRGGLPLSDAEADRYVAEQVRAARLIGIDPATLPVPRSIAELAAYFEEQRPRLELTRQAYDAAKFILAPPMPGWVRLGTPAVPAWAGLASLGFALLPRWARRMYALPGLPSTDLGATAAVRSFRTALMALPPSVREGPAYKRAQGRLVAEAAAG
jgi:uncharacterized protein (DUF2236 family)